MTSYVVPPFIRVDPIGVDIGPFVLEEAIKLYDPENVYKCRDENTRTKQGVRILEERHEYARAKIPSGKTKYLSYGLVFWVKGDTFSYSSCFFLNTSMIPSNFNGFTSGVPCGVTDDPISALKLLIKELATEDFNQVGIYEIYDEDPAFFCSDLFCGRSATLYDYKTIDGILHLTHSSGLIKILGESCIIQNE